MKNKFGKREIFTTPLTNRGYLAGGAFNRIYRTYYSEPWEPVLGYIASIFYLYGAEFSGIYGGFKNIIGVNKKDVLDYQHEPSIFFTYQNPPLVNTVHEIKIISSELKKLGYDMWYPYTSWPDKEGEKTRTIIEPLILKDEITSEKKEWKKNYDKLCKLIDIWQTDFLRTYKGNFNFKLKLYDYGTTARLTILDDKMSKMKDKKKINKRQQEYLKILQAYAEYLYKGFLKNGKLFPKCKYE